MPRKYIRYWYFCPSCPNIRLLTQTRATSYCGDCVRRHHQKKPSNKYSFDFATMTYIKHMKYVRVCEDCGDIKEVKQHSKTLIKRCGNCSNKNRVFDAEASNAKRKATMEANGTRVGRKATGRTNKPRKTKVSKSAIENERDRTRKHRAAVEGNLGRHKEEVVQVKTDEEMVAEFMAKKGVTACEDNKTSKLFDVSKGLV